MKYAPKIFFFFVLFVSPRGYADNESIIEVAPFELMSNQFLIRAERAIWRSASIYGGFEYSYKNGLEKTNSEQTQGASFGGTYYLPFGNRTHRLSLAGGVGVWQHRYRDKAMRNGYTWVKMESDERYDIWETTSRSIYLEQMLCYRIMFGPKWTMSVSLNNYTILDQQQQVDKLDVKNDSNNYGRLSRASSAQNIRFLLGFAI